LVGIGAAGTNTEQRTEASLMEDEAVEVVDEDGTITETPMPAAPTGTEDGLAAAVAG
jgi:hypothetical protein